MTEPSPYLIPRAVSSSEEEARVLSRPLLEEEGLDLWSYWRVLRKRRWQIATFFFSVVLIIALLTFMMTPIYTAETTLLIEPTAPQVIDFPQVISESLGRGDQDYYSTQYNILKSRSLAAQVIGEQGLEENLVSAIQKTGLVARLSARIQGWAEEWEWAQGLLYLLPSSQAIDRLSLINTYIENLLEIKPVGNTHLVEVAFSTPDPELSARVANAHAQAYIRQGLKLRSQASEEAQRFLEGKLTELKERVEKSEDALNQYRRLKGIISLDEKENLVVDRLADLNKRLTEAEAERIALEAQVRLIQKRSYDSLPAVIDNTLIRTLTEELARLKGDYASLSTQFKSGYPRVAQLEAQVEETQRRLEQEIQKVVKGIESAYLAAEAKEEKLTAAVERQKGAALSLKDDSVEYAILAREIDTNRQLYDSVLQRMKEMGVAAGIRSSNVFVIDEAEPPLKPSKPNVKLNFTLGAFLGLIGGVSLAFFLECLDNTLKIPEEVERYLRLPSLGVVPDFMSLDHRNGGNMTGQARYIPAQISTPPPRSWGKELILSYRPLSGVTEAYRMIRTSILLSQAGEPPRTVLFTSGTNGEGKTVTALNTAMIFAQMGVSVLMIDADLRRPRCHKILGLKNGPGLTEVLVGQREPQEVIQSGGHPHLFFLSCGSRPPNPAELVSSKKMQEILVSLREHFDYIFIDSPPVIPVSDTVLLSTMVDGVVLVVDGQNTQRQMVQEARLRLSHAQTKILGVVLNRINTRNGDYAYTHPYVYSYNPEET